jgi:protein pelota
MKIIKKDFRKGYATIKVENLDDLWYISQVIDSGDEVKARTFRKIKLGESDSRQTKVIKKPVTIKIRVEKVEFDKYGKSLRVSGIIVEGPDDVPRGSHHTIPFEESTIATIIKQEWPLYQARRLEDAEKRKSSNIILLVHDREEAVFALLKEQGYDVLAHIEGDVEKKDDSHEKKGDFYKELEKMLSEYQNRYSPTAIIIASPAFWKETLQKQITDPALKLKIHLATCSSVGIPAIEEVLKRPELARLLKDERAAQESALVEELLSEISKQGMAVYGRKETKEAVNAGAAKCLMVTDELIRKARLEGVFSQLESIMRAAEAMKGDVFIINSDNDAGKKLDGLGGIGAILRYKLNY